MGSVGGGFCGVVDVVVVVAGHLDISQLFLSTSLILRQSDHFPERIDM